MQKPLTLNNLPRKPPVNIEPIRVVAPITTADLGRGRVATPKQVTKVKAPIITLADLGRNRKRTTPPRGRVQRPDGYADYVGSLKAKNLWDVWQRGLWKGKRCFIVGGGPSLKTFDWSLFKGELSIGINRAFEKYDPSMMFCLDPRFWGWIVRGDFGKEASEKYEAFKGMKVWMNSLNFIFPDNIHVIDLKDLEPCGSNSGHAAINVAMALGANPIYLLGFDMKGDGKGRQKWFHDGYPNLQSESVYKGMIEALNEDAPRIKKTGTSVINLTPRSALKCFPTDTVNKVLRLKPKPSRPLVVSFYTENTSYKKEADSMIASVIRFGLDYDVVSKPNLGGWKKNTYYKAQFIREMMDKHPDRNILWLDADCAIMQYPTLFDDMKADIAVFIADWKKIGAVKARVTNKNFLTHTELINSVIYVANNKKGREVIDYWIKLNKKNFPTVQLEQANLYQTLKEWKKPLKVVYLPPAYCQVFDIMAHLGEPVIEQYQAARRLKGEVGK